MVIDKAGLAFLGGVWGGFTKIWDLAGNGFPPSLFIFPPFSCPDLVSEEGCNGCGSPELEPKLVAEVVERECLGWIGIGRRLEVTWDLGGGADGRSDLRDGSEGMGTLGIVGIVGIDEVDDGFGSDGFSGKVVVVVDVDDDDDEIGREFAVVVTTVVDNEPCSNPCLSFSFSCCCSSCWLPWFSRSPFLD